MANSFPVLITFSLLFLTQTTFALVLQGRTTDSATPTATLTEPRNLIDRKSAELSPEHVKIDSQLSAEDKKLKFMKIIGHILDVAKSKNLDIKSIKLGSDIQRVFDNPNIKEDLNQFVNDPNFHEKLQKLQRKVERAKKSRKLVLKKKHQKLQGPLGMAGGLAGGMAGGMAGGAGARKPGSMNFQFLPGIAGVPFPPMMMNGPHYHPPVSVTVNSIPNPNPRSTLNPFEIEQSNLSKQVEQLRNIKENLKKLNDGLSAIDDDVENTLNQKYQRVLEIGN